MVAKEGEGPKNFHFCGDIIFWMVPKENINHVQGQRPSIKHVYRGRGCILLEVRTHMSYLLPIESENLFLSQHCTYVSLPSEFWISIHNNKNRPILDNFRYLWKWNNPNQFLFLYSSHVLLKGAASSSRLLIYHCVKSIRIRRFSVPYFPSFGLNTEIYGDIQFECRKIRTRKTPNMDTFHAVYLKYNLHIQDNKLVLEERKSG